MFKVMTWNLENLFKPGAPSGPKTQALYEAKLEGLAAVINAQTPDVLGVQEVGDPDALADLLALLEGDWHQRVSAHPDGRGIRVACLSRHPITAHMDVVAFPPPLEPVYTSDPAATEKTMGRGALAVTVDPGAGE